MSAAPRRRTDERLLPEVRPLEGLEGVRRPRAMFAVPMNGLERDVCRRAVRELIEREGLSATTSIVLELLERAPSAEVLRRSLSIRNGR